MKGGIVAAQRAAVGGLHFLILRAAGVGIAEDAHCKSICSSGADEAGYIEAAAMKSAIDCAEPLPVEIDFRLPVDAVEVEPGVRIRLPWFGGYELIAIPEVGVEKRIGEVVLVVAEVGIGDCAVVQIAGEHGAGNGGDHPVAIFESRKRDLFTIRGHQRRALHSPASAGKVERTIGARRRLRCGFCDGAAGTEDLELAEHVIFIRLAWPGHPDANIAAMRDGCEKDIVVESLALGQGLKRLPVNGVGGDLDRALGGPAQPPKLYAIERAACAKIDVDPFLAGACAHPRAGEAIGSGDVHLLPVIEEDQFGNRPDRDIRRNQPNPIATIARWASEGNRLAEARIGDRHVGPLGSARAAQLRPLHVVVGAKHNICPAALRLGIVKRSQPHVDAIQLRRLHAAFEIELDPWLRAGDIDRGSDALVEKDLAALLGKNSRAAGGGDDPLRQSVLDDAVGDQLRGQVVVVGAGLIGGPVQGKVAVGGVGGGESGTGVLVRIAWVDADAARELLCLANQRGYKKQESNLPQGVFPSLPSCD